MSNLSLANQSRKSQKDSEIEIRTPYASMLALDPQEREEKIYRQIFKDYQFLMQISGEEAPKLPIGTDEEVLIRFQPEYIQGIDRLLKAQLLPAMARKIQIYFEKEDYSKMKALIDGQERMINTISKAKSPLVALQINNGAMRQGNDISDLRMP